MIIYRIECVFSQRVFFTASYKNRLSVDESINVSFMSELLKLRDNYLDLTGIFHLDQLDIATLILCRNCLVHC